jgi:hypothetical protein
MLALIGPVSGTAGRTYIHISDRYNHGRFIAVFTQLETSRTLISSKVAMPLESAGLGQSKYKKHF